jgi:hypothetical protein
MGIPVYVFTGFLESGKTKFIQETLEDERFNSGERTLLLVCEEGIEEYDISTYPHKNVYIEQIEDQSALTMDDLDRLAQKHRAERVVVELNGMQLTTDFYQILPEDWEVYQEVMFADGTTILSYNQNMRQLVVDKLSGCEMVVFNRMHKGDDIMPLHKLARALNRRVEIVYDYTDGTSEYDTIEDPLPYDLNKPIVEIGDDDYALFYRDLGDEPKKYNGKTVRFLAQVAHLKRDKENQFAPGRFVMTCCAEDITFMGLPCRWPKSGSLEQRDWVRVEAKIEIKHHILYKGGSGPVLTAISVTPAEEPAQTVCTF